jgi:MFS transporter, DHA1 family, multidrug resistance protein
MGFKEILSKKEIRSVLLTQFLTAMGFGVILPLLPFYAETLKASPTDLGLLTAIFALLGLIFAPIIGKMADKYGRKKVLMAGTLGFVISYVLFALSTDLNTLFLARALEGIMAAGIFPACISLLSDYTTEQQRGKAMALVGMTFSLGFILGPALGGLADSDAIGIKGAFFITAGLSFINFLSVYFQVKEPKKEKEESKDIVEKEVSFLEHISSPLLLFFLSSFMISFLVGGLQATLALFASQKIHFGAGEMGLVFTYIGFMILIFQYVSGMIVNRFGEIRMIQAGLLFSSVGFFLLSFLNDWLSILGPLTIFVLGNALVFPSVSSLISKRATGNRGAVMGLLSSFQSLGQFFGPLLGGILFTINPSYAYSGLAIIVFAFLVIFVFFSSSRKHANAA